jgi:hypothetical protein
MTDEELGHALVASGYRAGSNRYRIVSRIDREDWLQEMARRHVHGFPGDPEKNMERGLKWATGLGEGSGDHYRSIHSHDSLQDVPEAAYRIVRQATAYGWGHLNDFVAIDPRIEDFREQHMRHPARIWEDA